MDAADSRAGRVADAPALPPSHGGKVLRAAFVLAAYALSLMATYVVHVRFFRVDVVFYAALLDAALALPMSWAVLLPLRALAAFNSFEKTALAVVCLLCGYIFAITVPTVVDRSLSFYLLEKLDRHGGIRIEHFEHVIAVEYLREHRVADVRLTEQQASGTITVADGCVTLTSRGKRLARFGRLFRTYLLPRQRRVHNAYTDVLTTPFRGNALQASCTHGMPAH